MFFSLRFCDHFVPMPTLSSIYIATSIGHPTVFQQVVPMHLSEINHGFPRTLLLGSAYMTNKAATMRHMAVVL